MPRGNNWRFLCERNEVGFPEPVIEKHRLKGGNDCALYGQRGAQQVVANKFCVHDYFAIVGGNATQDEAGAPGNHPSTGSPKIVFGLRVHERSRFSRRRVGCHGRELQVARPTVEL